MKNLKCLRICLFVSFAFLVASCEKPLVENEINQSASVQQDYSKLSNNDLFNLIKVENDILSFKDENLAITVANRLSKLSINEMSAFESKLGFLSYYSLINQKQISGFNLLEKAHVLNSKGLVKIGDYIEYFNNTRYIKLKSSNLEDISKAIASVDGDYSNFFVSTIHSSIEQKNARPEINGQFFGVQSQNYAPVGAFGNAPRYYSLAFRYSWYLTGGYVGAAKAINYEVFVTGGCAFLGVPAAYTIDQTFTQLNGTLRVNSGFIDVPNSYQTFFLNGFTYNGITNTTILSKNNVAANNGFTGFFEFSAVLTSSDGTIFNYPNLVGITF